MAKLQTSVDAIYAAFLKKDQVERLRQIELRRAGPVAVLRRDVSPKVGLTADQRANIEAAQQEIRQEARDQMPNFRQMGQIFQNPDGSRMSREERTAKMEDPQVKAQMDKMQQQGEQVRAQSDAATVKAISRELTKKQKDKFNALLGKPFDTKQLERRPGAPGAENADAATAATDANADTKPATTASTSTKSTAKKKATTKTAKTKKSSTN